MAEDLYAVPNWLTDYVALWKDRLWLGLWHITLRLEHTVEGDPGIEAVCRQYPDLNEAAIVFRSDVEDTEDWRITVIHELLHVKHARIDKFLTDVVFPEMPAEEAERMAKAGYSQHMESFTHDMARCLYDMWAFKEQNPEAVAKVPARRTRNS